MNFEFGWKFYPRAKRVLALLADDIRFFCVFYFVLLIGHCNAETIAAFALGLVECKIHSMQQMLERFGPPFRTLKKAETHGNGYGAFGSEYRAA
jgi:hypothetical protein